MIILVNNVFRPCADFYVVVVKITRLNYAVRFSVDDITAKYCADKIRDKYFSVDSENKNSDSRNVTRYNSC